jgi:L-seryl-tRNA(Ser) seleniumtransferase
MSQDLLRTLPGVDTLLQDPALEGLSRPLATRAIRRVLDRIRGDLQSGSRAGVGDVVAEVLEESVRLRTLKIRRVINATGIVLHTNLGRAPLAPAAAAAVADVASGYSNVELDLATGKRGGRLQGVEEPLCLLTGAEAALVVNNNAAAVLLALAALAKGQEVVVSRGELVEIGGSFRVPEIMEVSGALLVEVGTTNRTRAADFEAAIGENTALVLRVHPSNFRVEGFTERPTTAELAGFSVPLVEDLGSGALQALGGEPEVAQVLADGADLVTFSGDKLLGGSQAGILVGSTSLVGRCRAHPMYRALRLDKLALAALEATLRLHLAGEAEQIPALAAISSDGKENAARLHKRLEDQGVAVRLEPDEGFAGGGSLPGEALPGWAVVIDSENPRKLHEFLRNHSPPILARVTAGEVRIDPRTLLPGEEDEVLAALVLASLRVAGHE